MGIDALVVCAMWKLLRRTSSCFEIGDRAGTDNDCSGYEIYLLLLLALL